MRRNLQKHITFAIQGSASSGLNVAINAQSGVYSISGFTADQGQVTFRATVQVGTSELDSVITIDKVYTISRAPEGTDAVPPVKRWAPRSLTAPATGGGLVAPLDREGDRNRE